MFHLVINALNQYLKSRYNQYGLNFDTVYSSDLDDLKQYTNNFNYRVLYKNDADIRMLEDLKARFTNTKDYAVLLFNYEPPNIEKTTFNQMNLQAYFSGNKPFNYTEFNKLDPETKSFLRNVKTNELTEENTFVVRDVKYINMKVNFKLITPNQEFLDNFTMLYMTDISRNLSIPVKINFGGNIGELEVTMTPEFQEIESWGLIDTTRAADLKHITFSAIIHSPVFSNFTDIVSGVKEIRLVLGVV